MVTELGLLVCFFVGLHFGGGDKTLALHNALSGFWGMIFWIGVFFIGILIPLVANIFGGDKVKHSVKTIILVSIFDLIGVLCLRYFILYAGQLTVLSLLASGYFCKKFCKKPKKFNRLWKET